MNIERRRWAVVRKNRTEILCGISKNYQFKNINNIGNATIKTYQSKEKAIESYTNSARYSFGIRDIEVVEMIERIEILS